MSDCLSQKNSRSRFIWFVGRMTLCIVLTLLTLNDYGTSVFLETSNPPISASFCDYGRTAYVRCDNGVTMKLSVSLWWLHAGILSRQVTCRFQHRRNQRGTRGPGPKVNGNNLHNRFRLLARIRGKYSKYMHEVLCLVIVNVNVA